MIDTDEHAMILGWRIAPTHIRNAIRELLTGYEDTDYLAPSS